MPAADIFTMQTARCPRSINKRTTANTDMECVGDNMTDSNNSIITTPREIPKTERQPSAKTGTDLRYLKSCAFHLSQWQERMHSQEKATLSLSCSTLLCYSCRETIGTTLYAYEVQEGLSTPVHNFRHDSDGTEEQQGPGKLTCRYQSCAEYVDFNVLPMADRHVAQRRTVLAQRCNVWWQRDSSVPPTLARWRRISSSSRIRSAMQPL